MKLDGDLKIKENITCSWCGRPTAPEAHTCPFKEEIQDDHKSLCMCCEDCEQQCSDSI